MKSSFEQYFKCPQRYSEFALTSSPPMRADRFCFGEAELCFGGRSMRPTMETKACRLPEDIADSLIGDGVVTLPFDLEEVVDGLRLEQYVPTSGGDPFLANLYYRLRPFLPVSIRKYLQRARLNGWERIAFPHWPVDRTVDDIFGALMGLSLRAHGTDRIPFIWFWPGRASSCAIVTHDVETASGRDFSATLMDIDDRFGIKASFQIVPERRYDVSPAYRESIRRRGFEVGVQDLNHDGQLFKTRAQFLSRVKKINDYGREWNAKGFRAAILYRREEWFDALEFSYDMSIPNVAHLDPQRGGCCTVMPFFIGKLLELPVTTTQDYSLFNILKDYSLDLWKRQVELIMENHGLASFIIHPDYITRKPEQDSYERLLGYLAKLREEQNLWIPTAGEVDEWWRQRDGMQLVEENGNWRIQGEGHERAVVAYATEKDGQIQFALDSSARASAR